MSKEIRTLCEELPRLQERLFRAGLIKTAKAMQPAVEKIGFEAANKLRQAKGEAG